jgi:hypothetical protein
MRLGRNYLSFIRYHYREANLKMRGARHVACIGSTIDVYMLVEKAY